MYAYLVQAATQFSSVAMYMRHFKETKVMCALHQNWLNVFFTGKQWHIHTYVDTV